MVKRIVVNIKTDEVSKASHFYQDILELDVLMDHGWIKTFGNEEEAKVQRDIFEARGHKQAYWIEVTDQSAEENNTGEKKD